MPNSSIKLYGRIYGQKAAVAHSGLDIPASYLEDYLAGSFSDTVQWWAAQKMEIPPETVAGYFLTVIENGIVHR